MSDGPPHAPVRFAKTVLLVDDRAFSGEGVEAGDVHSVEAKAITDRLADRGLTCATLAPGKTDDPDRVRVVTLAKTSDIVVLDWTIVSEGRSFTARPIVESILRSDAEAGGRLRLIVIYTKNTETGDIIQDVREIMDVLALSPTGTGPDLRGDNVRVTVVAKPGSGSDVRQLDGPDLADELPTMFAETFADGVLRRVALAGVVALREHSHELLTRFPADLDKAFLSHRAMTSPAAAEQFARQLVTDEVSTILANVAIEQWADQGQVDAVLDKMLTGSEPRLLTNDKYSTVNPIDIADARRVLSETRDLLDKWGNVASFTSLFAESNTTATAVDDAKAADELLTILSLFTRTHFLGPNPESAPAPRLGLGSVLDRGGKFWLCMQPLCDGVRLSLEEPTAFPLLPLEATTKPGDPFDIVVPTGVEERVRLCLCVKLKDLILPRFAPEEGRVIVIPEVDRERRIAPIDEPDSPFRWLGQLRLDHAQRFAAMLGHSAARIGLDEPEWSRRRAPKR